MSFLVSPGIRRVAFLVVLLLGSASTTVFGEGVGYDVSWPGIHLEGTFTLNVQPAFGTYVSSQALGTYGGVLGTYNEVWTMATFTVSPNMAQLDFTYAVGSTGYAVTPDYVGRPTPWTSALEAWQDLIAGGARDGVIITPVPEPSVAALGCACLGLVLMLRRQISKFLSLGLSR